MTTYGIKWKEWKKPKEWWQEPTEQEERSRTFASAEARERFCDRLLNKKEFIELTDYWNED